MGYTTEFEGHFNLEPALTKEQVAYVNALANTRRMKRDVSKSPSDPIRESVGLPPGDEGEFFVGGLGLMGQDQDPSVVEFNFEPVSQPGLWLQWNATDCGSRLQWDGAEKFYYYVEWLQYLIDKLFSRWGTSISGEVSFQGEEMDDHGVIYIEDGKAKTKGLAPLVDGVKSPSEFLAIMKGIANTIDEEKNHYLADKALCELLTELGYGEAIKVFEGMDKRYA